MSKCSSHEPPADQEDMERAAWYDLAACLGELLGFDGDELDSAEIEEQYGELLAYLRIWAEEYAKVRREQGDNAIAWSEKALQYQRGKLARRKAKR